MADIDRYFDEIDAARTRRVRELSEIKFRFGISSETDSSLLLSKATIVLTYAIWEGFYNECVRAYIHLLTNNARRVHEAGWMMLVGAFNREFEALRNRNHSLDAKKQFVARLQSRLECTFDEFDSSVIEARSNLDFDRLWQNYSLLAFDITPIQRFRNKLNKELVGWRHSVAHGDAPDLSSLDIAKHVDFVGQLLTLIADQFQEAMLKHA